MCFAEMAGTREQVHDNADGDSEGAVPAYREQARNRAATQREHLEVA